jgi:hypothetical protein
MATTTRPRLIFPLRLWDGPSGVTFIQTLNRDPITGDYFIGQADDVSGQSQQDIVIRRHLPSLRYADSRTIKRAGHGSSIGAEHDEGETKLWIGHDTKGVIRISYKQGEASTKRYTTIPNGDISVHRDVLVVRNGNTYTGFDLSDAKLGKTTRLFRFSIPGWGKRFQGHSVVSFGDGTGLVLVHRDMKTKGESKAVAYDFNGKFVDDIDTTNFGHEAEGFLIETDAQGKVTIWIVKRTGGNNKNRVVVATLWIGKLATKPTVPVDLSKGINRVFVLLGVPAAVKLRSVLKARTNGNTSRYTYYVQKWLISLSYYTNAADGKWGPMTQNAFDTFRRNVKPAWPESDCVGPPGLTSLTLLRNAAVKTTGKDTLKVTE